VLSALAIFVTFSIGGGLAQSIEQLIVFRTLQGIGGAGLYALAIILLIEVSTEKLLPLTSSLIGASIAIAGVLGPVVGGLFTSYVSWRWVFWINVPCGCAAAAAFFLGWPGKTTAYVGSRRRFVDFDYIGSLLLLSASVLVVLGLQEGGSGAYAWNGAVVLGTLIVGCACWILVFGYEYYLYKTKSSIAAILPMQLWLFRPMLAGIM